MKNGWRFRIAAGLLGFGVAQLHGWLAADVPNTDVGMFIYHWSAGCAEFLLLAAAPYFLQGTLCDRIQYSCVASILANGLGWLAYTAYTPPMYYDFTIGVISCGQILLLLVGGKHVDFSHLVGNILLRGSNPGRPELNLKKAQR